MYLLVYCDTHCFAVIVFSLGYETHTLICRLVPQTELCYLLPKQGKLGETCTLKCARREVGADSTLTCTQTSSTASEWTGNANLTCTGMFMLGMTRALGKLVNECENDIIWPYFLNDTIRRPFPQR
jgi:hypothetical protein